jgi:hypothetical protein
MRFSSRLSRYSHAPFSSGPLPAVSSRQCNVWIDSRPQRTRKALIGDSIFWRRGIRLQAFGVRSLESLRFHF